MAKVDVDEETLPARRRDDRRQVLSAPPTPIRSSRIYDEIDQLEKTTDDGEALRAASRALPVGDRGRPALLALELVARRDAAAEAAVTVESVGLTFGQPAWPSPASPRSSS